MSANVVIGATLRADGSEANKTVKSFKAELRAANEELLKMQDQFGEFSNEAITAAKRVATLRDSIGDARSLVDAFNPDRKFQAFGQSVQGVVGGFTALQGVLGLVGVEGEEVQKALLKVQSALAISQGLDDIMDSIQGFKNLGSVIKSSTVFIKLNEAANKAAAFSMRLFGAGVDTTSTSFKFLKGAIAATGIGVLIVLLGEAVSLFNDLAGAAERAAEAQQKAIEANRKAAADDLDYVTKDAERIGALKLALAKKNNASEREQFNIEQGIRREKQQALTDYINKVGSESEEGLKARREIVALENELQINQLNFETSINAKARHEQKQNNDRALAEAKRKVEEAARIKQQEIAQAQALNKQLADENAVNAGGGGRSSELTKLLQEFDTKAEILKKGGQSLLELETWYQFQRSEIIKKYREQEFKATIEAIDARLAKEKEAAEEKAAIAERTKQNTINAIAETVKIEGTSIEERKNILDAAEQQIMSNKEFYEENKTSIDKAFSDARVEIARQEGEAKMRNMEVVSNTLGAFSTLLGKQTAAGKVLAVAQATIDTYKAANMALASAPPPFNYIAMAGTIAAGIGNVREIIKTKVPGANVTAPTINSAPPLKPQLQMTNTLTTLDRGTINAIGNQAIKAFIVESDVTNQQEKIRRINRAARLG